MDESTPYELSYPDWVSKPNIPKINQLTEARVNLGKMLFFDPVLSKDSTVSCASCHKPEFAFADNAALSKGIKGGIGKRNTPGLTNIAWYPNFFRDGTAHSLELMTFAPMTDLVEMGLNYGEAIERIGKHPYYAQELKEAYPEFEVGQAFIYAIAAYQRTLVSYDSPFDRYYRGKEEDAISESAKRGWELFKNDETNCIKCHSGENFTQFSFENIGLYEEYAEIGRARFTLKEEDKGKYRTPGLRNVALTAPYMHDGSIQTLEDVILFYESGGEDHPNKSHFIQPFTLTEEERKDMIAFLEALTDEQFIIKNVNTP